VGHLERRLRKLVDRAEARGASPAKQEEARQQREQAEAFSRLSVEDLSAMDELLDRWEDSGTFEDLDEVVDERGLRAFARYEEVLEAVRREGAL